MPALSYQERKELGRCTRDGCPREAQEDSQLCLRHLRVVRKAVAEANARRREARRAAGLCSECPGDKPSRATEGNSTCLPCRIKRKRLLTSEAAASRDVNRDRSADIAARTRTHADGRTRYHGQGKRGQQPAAQLNRQDLGMARSALDAGEQGLGLLETPEVQQLPRIQREDVKRAAAAQLDRAGRHIDDVLERIGHFGKRHGKRDGEQ